MTPEEARSELDGMVVEIELTLISIIQGVALTFLIERARELVSVEAAVHWPYVIAGLTVIFVFWSRSVLHIITVIRWPLEFGHNFLYIMCALVEAVLFTRLTNPSAWFGLGALFGFAGWILFTYDLRLIRAREIDSAGPASNELIQIVKKDQWLNIAVLVPAVALSSLACFLCIRIWPVFFLERQFHVVLAIIQLIGFVSYLVYVITHFRRVAPFVARARAEWRSKLEA
ncbi:MAG TPA: hypothetical protein VJ719_00770 [Chthoniobacterales bacterium]|nr:hypothetical protein [Chthoniobacterales bacterium]